MKNLIILLGCMTICSTTPSWAQTNSEPPIETRILEYYKQAGQGSIVGYMRYHLYTGHNTGHKVIAQNVRVFFIPGFEYTRTYTKNYRKSLKDYAHAVYRNNNEEKTELHLEDLDPRVFSVVKSTITDQKGSFQIHNLQPGWYYLLAEWRASYTRLKTTYYKDTSRKNFYRSYFCISQNPGESLGEWWSRYTRGDCDNDDAGTYIRQVQTPELGYYLATVISPDPIIVKKGQTTIAHDVMLLQTCATEFCDEFKHSQWFDDAARATSIPIIKR